MAADANGQVTPCPKPAPKKPASKRRPINPVSEKRRATFDVRRSVRLRVFDRDGGCLLHHFGDCFGEPLTPHHRRKEGQGGRYTMRNLLTLCSWHNDGLEADADYARWARFHGVVLLRNDDPNFLLVGCPRSCEIDHRPNAGPAPTREEGDRE